MFYLKSKLLMPFFAAALLLSATISAHAAVTTYSNDLAGWVANTSGSVVEDFEDTTLVPGVSITNDVGGISGGVFTSQISADYSWSVLFNFSSPIYAFGADWNLGEDPLYGGAGSNISLHIVFADNSVLDLIDAILGTTINEFWGLVSDKGITSIELLSGTGPGIETFGMDNLRFSNQVPEPGSLALLGVGIAGLGVARRRKSRAIRA